MRAMGIGTMEPWGVLVATGAAVGLMVAVVGLFRLVIRKPPGITSEDPIGLRTVAIFQGDDPELFADDGDGQPLVGVRLFGRLCEELAGQGILIAQRGTLQNAQVARCAVEGESFDVVLEWHGAHWVVSVEYAPRNAAEARHLRLTHAIYAPRGSNALRRLLGTLDACLKRFPALRAIQWHRKEDWLDDRMSYPAPSPFGPESGPATA